jgi:hypothetical protein
VRGRTYTRRLVFCVSMTTYGCATWSANMTSYVISRIS